MSVAAKAAGAAQDGPQPPANLEPFVRILGVDGAMDFLAEFGGAPLHLSERPHPNRPGRIARVVGHEKAAALAAAMADLPRRCPLGKRWMAQVLAARGVGVYETARRLRASDVQVRRWLRPPETDQGDLFD